MANKNEQPKKSAKTERATSSALKGRVLKQTKSKELDHGDAQVGLVVTDIRFSRGGAGTPERKAAGSVLNQAREKGSPSGEVQSGFETYVNFSPAPTPSPRPKNAKAR